jgi:two-component system cell cycle response regulator
MTARILIIEDNPANLELMRYLVHAFDYQASVATSGEEGVEAAQLHRPDLILCDIQLPGIDGYEVVRRLRGQPDLAAIPVIAVTALAMVGDRDKVLAAGFEGYLSKPIDPEAFVGQVESFLAVDKRNAPHARVAATSAPAVESATSGRTILAVDNLQVNLDLVASLFRNFGYQVVAANTRHEALQLARQSPPDLILSDVCMPEGSGYDLIAAVKADPSLKEIPFVFITSTVTNEDARRKGLALGAAKFLFRPIEPRVLLDEIEACLPKIEAS